MLIIINDSTTYTHEDDDVIMTKYKHSLQTNMLNK